MDEGKISRNRLEDEAVDDLEEQLSAEQMPEGPSQEEINAADEKLDAAKSEDEKMVAARTKELKQELSLGQGKLELKPGDTFADGVRQALQQGGGAFELNGFKFKIPDQIGQEGLRDVLEQYNDYLDKFGGSKEDKINKLIEIGKEVSQLSGEMGKEDKPVVKNSEILATNDLNELLKALEGDWRLKNIVQEKVIEAGRKLNEYLYFKHNDVDEKRAEDSLDEARKILSGGFVLLRRRETSRK